MSVKENGSRRMNLHFTFSVREISEIADDEQKLRIPMYLSVEWEVVVKKILLLQSSFFFFLIISATFGSS